MDFTTIIVYFIFLYFLFILREICLVRSEAKEDKSIRKMKSMIISVVSNHIQKGGVKLATLINVRWNEHLERMRSNKANEAETHLHNTETRNEIHRNNLVQESINAGHLVETKRSNQAREKENKRHNKASEKEERRSNKAREKENTRSNQAREHEQQRSNMSMEDIRRLENAETARSNRVNEKLKQQEIENEINKLTEQIRSNKKNEQAKFYQIAQQADTAAKQLKEQYRHNTAQESQQEYKNATDRLNMYYNNLRQFEKLSLDKQTTAQQLATAASKMLESQKQLQLSAEELKRKKNKDAADIILGLIQQFNNAGSNMAQLARTVTSVIRFKGGK